MLGPFPPLLSTEIVEPTATEARFGGGGLFVFGVGNQI